MTTARKRIVDPDTCRLYHITGRCVQRAFLCGFDKATGIDYEYRRQWVIDRLETLALAFCIDVVAYAIMSNHYHLVLHLNPGTNDCWDDDEVFARWSMLYNAPEWVREVRAGQGSVVQQAAYQTWIRRRRAYLADLSWFMKSLNEPIAKAANRESGATGAFWQARFKSKALLNEKALLACMAYVDLNPIRAKMAKTPEESEFTSIRQRIRQLVNKPPEAHLPLLPFAESIATQDDQVTVPCTFTAYVELVEATGRILDPRKRGAISAATPPILERLGYDQDNWKQAVLAFKDRPSFAVGSCKEMKNLAETVRDTARAWFSGFRVLGKLYE